jgi:hypothetical protein
VTAIRNGDGWIYVLTSTDKLWAGRMAQYEGGEAADVLWTMTQAYARTAIHDTFPTFTRFIQAYSQPINPKWRRDGVFCRPGGTIIVDGATVPNYSGRDNCSEVRLARRDIAATMPWSGLDASVREITEQWYAGTLRNPVPRAVDFAAPDVAASFVADHPGSEILKRLDNWYIGTRASLRWPADWVTMDGSVAAAAGGGLLVVAALGAGAWWAWRRSRRAPVSRLRGLRAPRRKRAA